MSGFCDFRVTVGKDSLSHYIPNLLNECRDNGKEMETTVV